ncbi:MAG TPA: SRPBCC family protein [Chloroflexota bacterium]|nr:SRPBCC family protein [Chloroflexota bacterium]
MARAQESITINRPIEAVYAYVADVHALPDWASNAVEVKDAPAGALTEGATYTTIARLLGRRLEIHYRVTRCEPGRRLVQLATGGPVPHTVVYTFSSAGAVTRVTQVIEGEPGGFFTLAAPLVVAAASRQMATNLAQLKDRLEAQE